MSEVEGQVPTTEEVSQETSHAVDTNDSINGSLDEITDSEVLKSMIKKLRGENAGQRKEKQKAKSQLEEFEAWKASQMSDLDREKSRADKAEQKYRQTVVKTLALEYGVEDDLVDLILSDDEDEMRERAERLGNRSKKDNGVLPGKAAGSPTLPGKRGPAVGSSGPQSDADWFKGWISENR